MTFTRTAVAVIGLVLAILNSVPVAAQEGGLSGRVEELEDQVETLQAQVAALQAALNNVVPQNLRDLANYVSVDLNTIETLVGPHVIFTGANVHIQNGLGATNGDPDNDPTDPFGLTNGLGNLLVGYNEHLGGSPQRNGSHNLVIGPGHRYTLFGGFVAGHVNTVTGAFATVSAGAHNEARGFSASVSGGQQNLASGLTAAVLGGEGNLASGHTATVSGGENNISSGTQASILGGVENIASFQQTTVGGGANNRAIGFTATVSGGRNNTASGVAATVSGGENETASTDGSHVP